MALAHISLDPEVAQREQRIEAARRIGAATDELNAALAALAALAVLDELDARRAAQARPTVERRTLSLQETARALGVGMTTLNGLVRSGAVESVWIGASRKVRTEALDRYLDRLSAGVA